MRSSSSRHAPVAVIGAGPHGLSAVAHLRDAGIPTIAFGDPLAFWRDTMPGGMWLRSSPRASSISSPRGELSLARWGEAEGREIGRILPIGDFVDYGMWFKDRVVPDLDMRMVASAQRRDTGFQLTLSDGEDLTVGRIVVATGLGPFAHVPSVFGNLPPALVSHASACSTMETFAGRTVAVIGTGQSALESAALLAEAGAQVEIIGRAQSIVWLGGWSESNNNGKRSVVPKAEPTAGQTWRARRGLHWRPAPTEVGGRFSSWIGAAPDVVRHFPRAVRAPLTYRCIRPAGAGWLPDRLRAVELTLGREVLSAREQDGGALLRLDDVSTRQVDHVLLGTGYKIDVRAYPFLEGALAASLRVVQGSPVLGRGLESSIPGLHFVGAPAAESFGPAMRFVVGTAYTGPALAQGISGRRTPVFRWAF
jgi:cation diffusion facilitator CzcD-associated flavoprotein CzcO